MSGRTIYEVPLVSEVQEGMKFPISDGSNLPQTASVKQINAFITKKVQEFLIEELSSYVKKESGKGLSTNDFTTELKNKLNGLKNYDDSLLVEQMSQIQNMLDSVISGNSSKAIESFNEIVAFLKNIQDNETLEGIVGGISTKISGIETKLSELGQEVRSLTVVDKTIQQSGTTGYYINCNGGIGATVSLTAVQSSAYPKFKHYIQECSPGEHIIVNGTGSSTARLWCFCDANNKIVSCAGGNETGVDLDLTVPIGANFVIINDTTGLGVQTYRTEGIISKIEHKVEKIEDSVENLCANNKQVDVILELGVDATEVSPTDTFAQKITRNGLAQATVFYCTKYPVVSGKKYKAHSTQVQTTDAYVAYYNGSTFISTEYSDSLPQYGTIDTVLHIPDNADTIYLCGSSNDLGKLYYFGNNGTIRHETNINGGVVLSYAGAVSPELAENASVVNKYGRKSIEHTAASAKFVYRYKFTGLTIGRKYRINIDKTSWNVSECTEGSAIIIGCLDEQEELAFVYYRKFVSQAVDDILSVELPIEVIADTSVLTIGLASNVGVSITAVLDELGDVNAMSEDYRLSIVEELVDSIDPSIEIIPVAYIAHAEESNYDDVVKNVRKHIKPGEYGLIQPYVLYLKGEDGSLSKAVRHGNTVEGTTELFKYYYKYCNGIYKFVKIDGARLSNMNRLLRVQTEQFYPKQVIGFSASDNQIVEYNSSDWDFTKNSDGNYTILKQCYAYLDALALENPNLVKKYDPMASATYEEGGIKINNIPFIRNRMNWAGFLDYPVYAQGIDTPGEYTIGDYVVNLLKTPAYKTFIYRLADDSINSPGVSYAPKRRILIQAGMHSAEVISQICACLFAKEMLSDNINAYTLLSHYDIWIVPCLNGYGGFHDSSLTALGVNGNRNYDTPWWIKEDNVADSGLAAADQFETKLSILIVDYLKPDVAIDAHTLSNSIVQVAPETSTVHIEGVNGQVAEAIAKTGVFVKNRAVAKYPDLFTASPKIYLASSFANNATFRSYAYYSGCLCAALIETNNSILGQGATLNGDAAISVSAYQLKNLVFSLCEYNITNYKCRFTGIY